MFMRKKKKMKNNRRYEKVILCIIGILIICLIGALIKTLLIYEPYYKIDSRLDKLEESKKIDSDDYKTVGWLKVQGSKIDMPILKTNDLYPVTLEEYAWTMAGDTNYHNVLNIMGHNIFNLGPAPTVHSDNFHRFEDVMSFVYYDIAKENKYIQLSVNGEEYLYKIFAASFLYGSDVYLLPNGDYSKEQVKSYINLMKQNSIYDYDVDTKTNDNYISLITCTRFFGTDGVKKDQFLIVGRRVRENEKIKDYQVKKNDKYKSVESVLKGDSYEKDSV